ncbi:hypothetical protein MBLNU13_g04209t1 [Cladosporium sp. NU13]
MLRELSDLPAELVEQIVCLLDLTDLCNLRLANRATEAVSSQGFFKSFFITKTLQLDTNAISRFAAVTGGSRFTVCLQNLRLVGLPLLPDDEASGFETENALCDAFIGLQKHFEHSDLRSLNVSIEDEVCGNDHTLRFATGAFAVRTVLRALNKSSLPVRNLNLLADTPQCSVPCNVFEDLFASGQPSISWSRLRSLSLSLSVHQRVESDAQKQTGGAETGDHDGSARESIEAGKQRVQALTDFLTLLPAIEQLHLHWYNLRRHTQSDADLEERRWFDNVSQVMCFDNLRDLTLRGLDATESSLIKILMAAELKRVHLEYVRLQDGSLRPLLDHLTGGKLDYFYLDDIFEDDVDLAYFLIEGEAKFKSQGDAPGPSTVERWGQQVTVPLDYDFVEGRALGSPERARYLERCAREFGPPTGLC